ncbi:DMT family transporter [Teichococcus coralli]|uniref:DMT family transporter n=1 Tax=Teichococcus coralli TaxID=2545983 RepID=UPI001F46B3F2|nr:DMT family transporter [Pseudoroseomonas coralli]
MFLAITAVGWGLNWPALKLVLHDLPPLTARAVTALLATGGLTLVASLARVPLRLPASERGAVALAGLLNVGGWMGLSTLGLLWLPAGEGAVVAYTMPVWAALLAWPVLGERPTPARLLALLLGLGGVALLMTGGPVSGGAEKLPGVLLVMAAAICFALGAVTTKRRPLRLHPVATVIWQVGLGCLPVLAGAVLLERPAWKEVSTQAWAALAFMAILPLSICYMTWFAALRRLPASTAAMGVLAAPLVSVLVGAAALGEALGWRQAVALALTMSGVVLALRG